MKKNLIYAMLLIGLAILVWFLVVNKSDSSLSVKETAFAVSDTSSIYRIFLADLGDRQVELERTDEGWKVNNNYPVRPDAIQTLLYTIGNLRIKYPVPEAKHNNVVREIAGNHIKVELYNKKGRKIKSYFIGGSPKSFRGNYMKLETGKQVFVVQLPGFDGFLNTRFILDESEWRNRMVFSLDPSQIQELSVTYTLRTDSSWTLTRRGPDDYIVKPLQAGIPDQPLNKRATFAYLQMFEKLGLESYENDYPKKDSLLLSQPICIISLTDTEGKTKDCYIYHRPLSKRSKSQFDLQGNELVNSRDKYFASINEGQDFVLIQDFVWGKLFVGYGYFYQVEKTEQTVGTQHL